MATPLWWRRARQHFSIDAPRMSVRSRLPWPWRALASLSVVVIIGGMWWWGYDFGQIFGGIGRREIEARLATLEHDNARLRTENGELEARAMQLESELAMTRGAQGSLSRQALMLQAENSQTKEELAFLQQLLADSNKQSGLSIQRLSVERERDDAWHYSVLVVRGGTPSDEFDGRLTLQAAVQPLSAATGAATRPLTITLPDDAPDSAAALGLRFKYYQRLEGSIQVPKGAAIRSVTARAFEAGQANAKATRNLVMP